MEVPNIIIIVLDTLRKDYDVYFREWLEKIGFKSYENVITPSPWTTPAHASMFTGLYPSLHNAHEDRDRKMIDIRLSGKHRLLSDLLSKEGYETYLLSANSFIHPYFGFKGFDYVIDLRKRYNILSEEERNELIKLKHDNKVHNIYEMASILLRKRKIKIALKDSIEYVLNRINNKWPLDKGVSTCSIKLKNILRENGGRRPFFIFINLMEAHEPYGKLDQVIRPRDVIINAIKTGVLNEEILDLWRRKYPKAVEYLGLKLRKIIEIIKSRVKYENSLIVVTSDHGQLLGEYNMIGHGIFLYDELLKVPLFIKYPRNTDVIENEGDDRYMSLTRLMSLILNVVKEGYVDENIIYSEKVFAESFGIHLNYKKVFLSDTEGERIEDIEKYRIAVYHSNYKGIFNVHDWRFEKVISYNDEAPVDDSVKKLLRNDIMKHLHVYSHATALRRIKEKITGKS